MKAEEFKNMRLKAQSQKAFNDSDISDQWVNNSDVDEEGKLFIRFDRKDKKLTMGPICGFDDPELVYTGCKNLANMISEQTQQERMRVNFKVESGINYDPDFFAANSEKLFKKIDEGFEEIYGKHWDKEHYKARVGGSYTAVLEVYNDNEGWVEKDPDEYVALINGNKHLFSLQSSGYAVAGHGMGSLPTCFSASVTIDGIDMDITGEFKVMKA